MSGTAPPPAGEQDQSMDDILASIRRILNEDEASALAADAMEAKAPEPSALQPPAASSPPMQPLPDIAPPPITPPPMARSGPEPVELTSDMLVTPPNRAATQVASPPHKGMEMNDVSDLIAPATAAAAAASVGSLLRAVSSERGAQVYRGGPSIEDLVREEIRPILKDWLDNHLPPLVERLVRAEIERVVNRALP